MIITLFLFILGLFLLYLGAEGLVKGAASAARSFNVRPVIIGLTLVAFGTSLPEAMVSLMAALQKTPEIAFGNVVGSNIANIGLILGLSALIRPIKIEASTLKIELPFMAGVSILLFLFALNGKIGFAEGIALFLGLGLFLFLCFKTARSGAVEKEKDITSIKSKSKILQFIFIIVSIVLLIAGAKIVVQQAIKIAVLLKISPLVISLSLIAFGTSLPELAASIAASFRKKSEFIVGNVIGSNIFNILFVLGLCVLIYPVTVTSRSLYFNLPVMLAFTFICFLFMKTGFVIRRIEGLFLLLGYGVYISFLFLR